MKYIIVVPDGMSDLPEEFEGGRTPLSEAEHPVMNDLARRSEVGWAETVPQGMEPGSDVAALSIFGLSPTQYYTGRAPLEAASLGLGIGDGVAYRCNLVTIRDEVMADFTAGHITSPEAAELIRAVDAALGKNGVSFHPGVSYRHAMLAPAEYLDAKCTPPHDITDRPIGEYLPKGAIGSVLLELMEKSRDVFENHPVNLKRISDGKKPATQIWLWGQGKKPALPTMKDRFGLTGAVVTAVDLVKGIGLLLGLEVPVVEGVTGFVDTNYEGKADAVLEALHRLDFAYAHIEAPDEAGHIGDGELKRHAIEDVDRRFLRRLVDGLNADPALQPYRLLLLPDHPTPISIKTHIRKGVPYFLYDSRKDVQGTLSEFSESAMQRHTGKRVPGFQLMDFLLERNG
ncbi:MAG TPA: cofactor-independent phosphoglycerate mutase [bacterium]|mgnify:CR=1 FL=1|nr:cofactor-independent phosphoglycerate mutase [bacterium]HQL63587.1 cofactor-independent phosphoglycerate mutase [bacterium]